VIWERKSERAERKGVTGREGQRRRGEREEPQDEEDRRAVGWRHARKESKNSKDERREGRREGCEAGRREGEFGSWDEEPVIRTC
jgi:hypothetical protein